MIMCHVNCMWSVDFSTSITNIKNLHKARKQGNLIHQCLTLEQKGVLTKCGMFVCLLDFCLNEWMNEWMNLSVQLFDEKQRKFTENSPFLKTEREEQQTSRITWQASKVCFVLLVYEQLLRALRSNTPYSTPISTNIHTNKRPVTHMFLCSAVQ